MARGRRQGTPHTTQGAAALPPRRLDALRAALDALGSPDDSGVFYVALMQTTSEAMRSALLAGEHETARAMADEAVRRRGNPPRRVRILSETDAGTWRDAERLERIRPYAPAALAMAGPAASISAAGSGARTAPAVLEQLAIHMPEWIEYAPPLVRLFEKIHDDLWGTARMSRYREAGGERRDAHAHFSQPVTSARAFRHVVRLALRERFVRDYPPGAAMDLQLVAASPEAFIDVARFLHTRPGGVDVVATREWSPVGRSAQVRRHRALRACARTALVVEGIPFTVELTLPVGETGARTDAPQVAQVAKALRDAGGGDLAISPTVQLASRANSSRGIFTQASCAPESRANLAAGETVCEAAETWLGPERCSHSLGTWRATLGLEVWRLSCPSCLRMAVTSVPIHQLPEPQFTTARAKLRDEAAYLDLERFRAVMEGRDPQTVPASIDALRDRDGVRSLDPEAYAIGKRRSRQVPRLAPEAVLAGAGRRRR